MADELRGDLSNITLPQLFTLMRDTQKTGTLSLEYSNNKLNAHFAFSQGQVGRVRTHFAPRLTDMMLDMGASPEQIAALRNTKGKGISKVTVIGSVHDIPFELTLNAMRKRHEMALLPIYNNTAGNFLFTFSASPEGFISPGIDPLKLALDVARRLDEIQHLSTSKLDPEKCFGINEIFEHQSVEMKSMGAEAVKLLSNLLEAKSLRRAALQSMLAWDELLKALDILLKNELVQPIDMVDHKLS
jgi:hypothetical protein